MQGRQKIALAQMFLSTQLNLLLVDVDVAILGDVLRYFRAYRHVRALIEPGGGGAGGIEGEKGTGRGAGRWRHKHVFTPEFQPIQVA